MCAPGPAERPAGCSRFTCAIALAAALALVGRAAVARSSADASFDFLHVEANEGGASGGHAALRFGDEVFHFQHEASGRLRLFRDDAASFEHSYARVGNRPIHVLRVTTDAETASALRDAFVGRRHVDDALAEHARALSRSVEWIEAAQGLRAAPAVRGLGLFAWSPDSDPSDASDEAILRAGRDALARVGARIELRGGGSLVQRVAEAERSLARELAALLGRAGSEANPATPGVALVPWRLRLWTPTTAERIEHAVQRVAALRVLQSTLPLARSAWLRDDDARMAALDAAERARLAAMADRLEVDLASLVDARRTDAAESLLVGLARLAAARASVATGRLVLLDAFADEAVRVAPHGRLRSSYLDALEAASRRAFEHVREGALARSSPGETDLAALESCAGRWLEVHRARTTGNALRIQAGSPIPSRAGRLPDLVLPPAAAEELARAQAEASDFEAALAGGAGYDLLTRNCVTELFAVIDHALATLAPSRAGAPESDAAVAADAPALHEAWLSRLGGQVDARGGLRFIPFRAATAVEEGLRVAGRSTVPSERDAALARLRSREPGWRVALRESNVLSSTLHRPGFGDSTFLFFTADAAWLGPILGTMNLAWALADTTLGLLTWPVEGPRRIEAGVRGALYSIPELGFTPLRKGSWAFVDDAVGE